MYNSFSHLASRLKHHLVSVTLVNLFSLLDCIETTLLNAVVDFCLFWRIERFQFSHFAIYLQPLTLSTFIYCSIISSMYLAPKHSFIFFIITSVETEQIVPGNGKHYEQETLFVMVFQSALIYLYHVHAASV